MEPNVFLGYLMWGNIGVLSSFEHEQYPSNSVDQNKTYYLNEGIGFLVGFGRAMQYPLHVSKDMVWSPMYFWDTLRRAFHVH
jgi:hypothetical protein